MINVLKFCNHKNKNRKLNKFDINMHGIIKEMHLIT